MREEACGSRRVLGAGAPRVSPGASSTGGCGKHREVRCRRTRGCWAHLSVEEAPLGEGRAGMESALDGASAHELDEHLGVRGMREHVEQARPAHPQ